MLSVLQVLQSSLMEKQDKRQHDSNINNNLRQQWETCVRAIEDLFLKNVENNNNKSYKNPKNPE